MLRNILARTDCKNTSVVFFVWSVMLQDIVESVAFTLLYGLQDVIWPTGRLASWVKRFLISMKPIQTKVCYTALERRRPYKEKNNLISLCSGQDAPKRYNYVLLWFVLFSGHYLANWQAGWLPGWVKSVLKTTEPINAIICTML